MLELLAAALVFGVSGGLKPGALGVYVIHQTMSRGWRVGLAASFAPFVSDIPMVIAASLFSVGIQDMDWLIKGISVAGGLYLLWMAVDVARADIDTESGKAVTGSFWRAVKINLLNPVPYIFWFTVGAVYLLNRSIPEIIAFSVVMLGTLGLTKFLLAVFVSSLGQRFSPQVYTWILRALAIPLLIFALRLISAALDIE